MSQVWTDKLMIFITWEKLFKHQVFRLIDDLLKDILRDWKVKKMPDEWKEIAGTCLFFCSVVIAMYAIATTVYFPDLLISYFGKPKEARKLFFASNYPFDYHPTPIYEIVVLIQIVQCLFIVAADLLSQILLAALVIWESSTNNEYNLFQKHLSR